MERLGELHVLALECPRELTLVLSRRAPRSARHHWARQCMHALTQCWREVMSGIHWRTPPWDSRQTEALIRREPVYARRILLNNIQSMQRLEHTQGIVFV